MSRWQTHKLCEHTLIVMGQSPPGDTYNTEGRGLPFFQGKAEFGDEYPEPEKWCDSPLKIAEPGDVLLSVRAPVGPTNVARERCCIGRGLAAIRPRHAGLLPRFLRYFFIVCETFISRQGVGSTFDAIGKSVIEALEIPLPSLPEQERIVRILDEAEVLRRLRTQADCRQDNFLQGLFFHLFGTLPPTSSVLGKKTVGEVADLVTSGLTPLGGSENYLKEGPYFLRSQNVLMNRLDLSDVVCLPVHIHHAMSRTRVMNGDVLLNITGASIGRVTWVEGLDREANINQHVCLIRPKPNLINPVYLSAHLSSPFSQYQINATQAGASRQGLNHQQVRALEMFLPPKDLQTDFAARITEIHVLEAAQSTSRQRINDLFQSLLHRAFRGEL